VYLALTTRLDQQGSLRAGLDAASAADILYALGSPHMHQLLRRRREWSVDRYRRWLENALTRELLTTAVP
jgi:hypothetical protein